MTLRDEPAGRVRRRHFTDYVAEVKELRLGRETDAERLLLELVDATGAEADDNASSVAPWYYEQLAISYRKRNDTSSELASLDRFATQRRSPGPSGSQLLGRLAKTRARVQGGSVLTREGNSARIYVNGLRGAEERGS